MSLWCYNEITGYIFITQGGARIAGAMDSCFHLYNKKEGFYTMNGMGSFIFVGIVIIGAVMLFINLFNSEDNVDTSKRRDSYAPWIPLSSDDHDDGPSNSFDHSDFGGDNSNFGKDD